MRHTVFLIFLFLSVQTVRAQEVLTKDLSYAYLEKLIAACKLNYPRGKIYDDRISIAENGVKKAKLSYFDIISFSYLYNPNNNTSTVSPTYFGGYQFGFFANVGSLLQKPNFIKQAKAEYSASLHEKEAFDLNMESEVKKRYFTYVQKIVLLRMRSTSILDVESMLSNIRHKFEKGEETLDNYNKALLMHSDYTQNIISAEADVLIAKSSLEEVLGQKLEDIK